MLKIGTRSSTPPGRFTLTALTIILGVGVSHKVQAIIRIALTVVPMTRRVMLLPLGTTILLSLPRLFILRLRVLGTV